MAKFKQIPQNFMFRRLLKYWGDMMCNYNDDCRYEDFFAFARNCFDHDKVDGLLLDQSGTDHSWEITQMNELLQ